MYDYHNPVLLHPSVNALVTNPDGTYVDVTFGGGGHSNAILQKLSSKGRLISFDQDEDTLTRAPKDQRFTLVNHNFQFTKQYLEYLKAVPVDGILADLGISSHQIDVGERGFAHRLNGPLDMRMNRFAARTAAEVVNGYTEQDLLSVFSELGEIKNSKTLVRNIVQSRQVTAIDSTFGLRDIAMKSAERGNEQQYLARVFQALRIEVNDEISALKEMLQQIPALLKPGGRAAIITFHSLEDRLVKNFFRRGSLDEPEENPFINTEPASELHVITKKPVLPSEKELKQNPRSRSARLRVAEKRMMI